MAAPVGAVDGIRIDGREARLQGRPILPREEVGCKATVAKPKAPRRSATSWGAPASSRPLTHWPSRNRGLTVPGLVMQRSAMGRPCPVW